MPADPPTPPGAARLARVAALDLGTRRIGIAVSDELGLTVRPLAVIESRGPRSDAREIRSRLEGLDVGRLVIGLPLLDSGEEGPSARRTREQGDDLARRLGLPHEYVDESDSTLEARRLVAEGRAQVPAGSLDALAAALLLEEWLARRAAAP